MKNFSDLEFDILIKLLLPFDIAFPALQPYFDRLVFELSGEHDKAFFGEAIDFDEYRELAIKSRIERGDVTIHDKQYLEQASIALAAVLRKVPLDYPQIAVHADRVMYEVRHAVCPEYKPNETFEQFYRQQQMIRGVINSKVRGQG